jgi:hypothetical protein
MGTIGRLFCTIAGQLDRPGKAACHAACISPRWLQSIRSLSKSGELSGGRVTVPVPALSPSIMTSIWSRTDQSSNDETRRGPPLPPLSVRYPRPQALRGGI